MMLKFGGETPRYHRWSVFSVRLISESGFREAQRSMKSSVSPKTLIYKAEKIGLANRLRALVGYQAMSKILGAKFYLCWVEDDFCKSSFEQLFDCPEIECIDADQCQEMVLDEGCSLFGQDYWFEEIWKVNLKNRVPWSEFKAESQYFLDQLRPNHMILTSRSLPLSGFNYAYLGAGRRCRTWPPRSVTTRYPAVGIDEQTE